MNREQWEDEKKRLLEQAREELEAFEKKHGKKNLRKIVRTAGEYRKLKARVNPASLDNKLPEGHVVCVYEGFYEDYGYARCEEIVHQEEWKKAGWYRRKYVCGHDSNEYFCPKHRKEGRLKIEEECGWCEER